MLSHLKPGDKVAVHDAGSNYDNITDVTIVEKVTPRQIHIGTLYHKVWCRKTGRRWDVRSNYVMRRYIVEYNEEQQDLHKKQEEMRELCRKNSHIQDIPKKWRKIPTEVKLQIWEMVKEYM